MHDGFGAQLAQKSACIRYNTHLQTSAVRRARLAVETVLSGDDRSKLVNDSSVAWRAHNSAGVSSLSRQEWQKNLFS